MEQLEIKVGDQFLCKKDYPMFSGKIGYKEGELYKCTGTLGDDSVLIPSLIGDRHSHDKIANKLFFDHFELIKQDGPQPIPEAIQPNYYKFKIKGQECNMFDIGRTLGLSLELFSALKYFRNKGGIDKKINDLEKAKECIDLEIKNLKSNQN